MRPKPFNDSFAVIHGSLAFATLLAAEAKVTKHC